MKNPSTHTLFASFLAALVISTGSAAWALDSAQLFKAQCASCHGVNGAGNAALLAPPLAGADQAYVVRQLQNFHSKVRGGEAPQGPIATMQAIAQTLPDDDTVLGLARYIAKLKPVVLKKEPTAPAASLSNGKALFGVCVACHGSQGEGNASLGAPRLTHLPAWYLRTQLQAYRDGSRGAHEQDREGQQMRQVANEILPDEAAVLAVSGYLVSLGQKGR